MLTQVVTLSVAKGLNVTERCFATLNMTQVATRVTLVSKIEEIKKLTSEQTDSQAVIVAARNAIKSQQTFSAISQLSALLSQEPDHAEAYELLGIAYSLADNTAQACQAFERSTQLAPSRVSAHYNYALVLLQANELDQAEEENRVARYLDKSHVGAIRLEETIGKRIRERDVLHTAGDDFALIGSGPDIMRNPSEPWAQLICEWCGAKNFVTARTCRRCGSLIPEVKEIVPVE